MNSSVLLDSVRKRPPFGSAMQSRPAAIPLVSRAIEKSMPTRQVITFGHACDDLPLEPPHAVSESEVITTKTGRQLSLRQWFPSGKTKAEMATVKGPVFLLVPGLGGKSEWGTRMISWLINQQPLMYGMDTRCLGDDPANKGHLPDRKELVREIAETVDYLHEKHGGKVILTGVSLGGLISTHYLADNPEKVSGAILVAPAFRPAKSSFTPWFYAKVLAKFSLEKLGLKSPSPIKMPYGNDAEIVDDGLPDDAREQISSLSATSYYELMKLTYFEAFTKAKQIKVPTLVVIPEKDTVCSPKAMRQAFDLIPAREKTLLSFPNAHHNLIFEKYMVPLAQYVSHWMKGHKKHVNLDA
jgi:alpha-beta hydrolase superfamily lysophospholipase